MLLVTQVLASCGSGKSNVPLTNRARYFAGRVANLKNKERVTANQIRESLLSGIRIKFLGHSQKNSKCINCVKLINYIVSPTQHTRNVLGTSQ